MKNKKARTALCVAASLFFTALYIYALYSAYYVFKRGNGPEIALYTVLLALCGGVVMLLYTLTDKKREHSTANKITVPIVSAAVHAGVYLAVGFGVQLWMYASPVVYPLSMLDASPRLRVLVQLNPMTSPIEIFRMATLGTGTVTMFGIVYSLVFTAAALVLGVVLFSRIEKTFMDTV